MGFQYEAAPVTDPKMKGEWPLQRIRESQANQHYHGQLGSAEFVLSDGSVPAGRCCYQSYASWELPRDLCRIILGVDITGLLSAD